MTKYIFVLGGVISGLGKGVTSASIAAILKEIGYNRITVKKLDPYLNVDPGTLNPIEHGEVYVTQDGGETDLDLGYYERFADILVQESNSTSSGKLLYKLLQQERRGDFLGKTITMLPHFTNMIKEFIYTDQHKYDIIICEIGGSAGDYEANAFFETIRQIKQENAPEDVMICFLSYLVYYEASKELKTKPTQIGLRQLLSIGLQADTIFLRSEHLIDDEVKRKICLYGNIKPHDIIPAYNVSSIYQVPLEYIKEGFLQNLQTKLQLVSLASSSTSPTFLKWNNLCQRISTVKRTIKLALVGKYVELEDAYCSVNEAIRHAGWFYDTHVDIQFINARNLPKNIIDVLIAVDCVLVPGGFGTSGIEEIISVIEYCRTYSKPFFGICLGMQLSVIEFARHILGKPYATSREFCTTNDTVHQTQSSDEPRSECIVDLMTEWKQENNVMQTRTANDDLGGTLRLGSYPTRLSAHSRSHYLYGNLDKIYERHRHRYEVNIEYIDEFEKNGMYFTGLSPDGKLPEIVEIPSHPFFIACQFHPEFNSTPFQPHPLFKGLIQAALKLQQHKKMYKYSDTCISIH